MLTDKPNVLFLECGSSGQGGSFRSLKEHIDILRETMGTVVIVLVNDSVYEPDYEALDCIVIKLSHPLYTKNAKLLHWYNMLFSIARRINGSLALKVQLLFENNFAKKLVNIIKENNITRLHLNDQPMRNFVGFCVARKLSLPVISHMRTLNSYGFLPKFANYALQCNVKFIAISKAVKAAWCDVGIDPDKVAVIYNPVPVNSELIDVEKIYDLIYVGRLVDGKGLDVLLDAASALAKSINFTLAIVGDGPLYAAIQKKIIDLSLQDNVKMLGYQKNIHQFIKMSKILVLPTQNEGFGRVIVEAMKLKVAVIANAVGGVKELVQHHQTGLLYSGIVADLVECMIALLTDDKHCEDIIECAYASCKIKYTQASYSLGFQKIYQ